MSSNLAVCVLVPPTRANATVTLTTTTSTSTTLHGTCDQVGALV